MAQNSISESHIDAAGPRAGCTCGCVAVWIAIAALGVLAVPARAAVQSDGSATQPAQAGRAASIEVTDELGRIIEVPQPVRRIVSLAPSLTETIFALDAEDRLVGDTSADDFPEAAKTITHVGAALAPSLEQIAALHPDLVLATNDLNRRETVEGLARLGLAVYVTNPLSIDDVLNSTARIARIIGAGDRGDALVEGLRARLDALTQRLAGVPARRVLFVVWTQPLISMGKRTFLADALVHAGARSVVEVEDGWPRVSLEYVLKVQPEYLVFAGSLTESDVPSMEVLATLPGWRDLDAVRARRIAVVSAALERPCPRVVDAIEQLARLLHPEVFASIAPGLAESASVVPPEFCTEVLAACAR